MNTISKLVFRNEGFIIFTRKFMILFFAYLISIYNLSAQTYSTCGNGYDAQDNFFTYQPEGQDGIQIQYFKRGKMVSNICGDKFGYDIVISLYNKNSSPINCNYSIKITSVYINPDIIETIDLQNFSIVPFANGIVDYTFNFSGTIQPEEFKCGIIKCSFPNTNFPAGNWQIQNHQFNVTNNFSNINYFSGPNPGMFNGAVRYNHFINNVNSSDITFNYLERYFFHGELAINTNTNIYGYTGSNPFLDPLKIHFGNNASIRVQNSKTLDIYNVIAEGCDQWKGIEVETGATFIAENFTGSDANILVTLKDGSNGSLNTSFINNCYTGLMIEDNAILSEFSDNEIKNSTIGVYLNHASNIKLNPSSPNLFNVFKNCEKGVFSWFSTDIEVLNNRFESIAPASSSDFTKGGIVSVKSNLLIAGNQFKDSGIGLSTYQDNLYDAARNDFTDNSLGIRIENNKNAMFISENTLTGEKGIFNRLGRQPNFRDNHINNFDKGSGFSYGISSNLTAAPLLSLNYIYSSNSQGGAIFNKCNAGYVYNENYFSLLSQSDRQSCIELNGGMGNQVYNNHFDATTPSPFTEAFGLRASAGGMMSVFCNDFFQIEEAIVAEHGQTDVELKTNNLFDARVGIKIDKSVLGVQTHHGNLFTGPFGDMALLGVDLLPIQINNSQFIVNGNVNTSHVPPINQVSPAGLVNENSNGTAPTCSSITYTTSPRDRLLALCNYINSIRNNTTLDPIRKKNLLAFYYRLLAKYFPEINKPYCVNLFITAFNNSNIEKMNVVESKIDQLLEPQAVNQSLKDNHEVALTSYLDALENNTDVTTMRNNYYTASNALELAYSDRTAIEDQLVLDIESVLNGFTPEDSYDAAWLTLQLSFLKIFKEIKLDANEIAELQDVASLCPTDYGDVVYGSRALLSDFDNTRYELSECEPDAPRIKGNVPKELTSTTITPNPTFNFIEIKSTEENIFYSIVDVNGKLVVRNTPYNLQDKIDVSNLKSGVYFIKIFENGKETSQKLIKME